MMNNGLLQKKTVQPISECEMGTSYETIWSMNLLSLLFFVYFHWFVQANQQVVVQTSKQQQRTINFVASYWKYR